MKKSDYHAFKLAAKVRREKIRVMALTMSQRAIAKLMRISEARVSQIVNEK